MQIVLTPKPEIFILLASLGWGGTRESVGTQTSLRMMTDLGECAFGDASALGTV